MATKASDSQEKFQPIPFRIHPRVFAALGADLVTNDVVAVIELVKNSYDAFATNVWIRFQNDPIEGAYLEIEDDGIGMSREIIEDVWCLVATPFKVDNPKTKIGKKVRRVAGEKGLGRFSVSRLGAKFLMLTQERNSPCWEVSVNWSKIAEGQDLSSSFVHSREYSKNSPLAKSGTIIRIFELKEEWTEERISDLEENLARLITPFSGVDDFHIHIMKWKDEKMSEVRIEAPAFLAKPRYCIAGNMDNHGNIKANYQFRSLSDGKKRNATVNANWEQLNDLIYDRNQTRLQNEKPLCGPFSFEIRAWETNPKATAEIAETFTFPKNKVIKAIRAHKGISVYRDNILVLPKSDRARDWLGLDLRRVSKVGERLSTKQLVGYVSISAEKNPDIVDTSDRERLVSCPAVNEFEEILISIVSLLEREKNQDHVKKVKEKPMDDLFSQLSPEDLFTEVEILAEEGAPASKVIPLLATFSKRSEDAVETLQQRFVYYSHMATVGTIAQMLVHEIRNRTLAFGMFLDFVKDRFGPFKEDQRDLEKSHRLAESAVGALERLADTFLPLASRTFRRRKRHSILEDQINYSLTLEKAELERKHIRCRVPTSQTTVAVDPGELAAILLNLITNAIYWLGEAPKDKREIDFRLLKTTDGTRVRVWVNDTGPGLYEGFKDEVERIFWPGVTRKPDGIGMGLTVASELVEEYGGRMRTEYPGKRGGASFAFDLPLKK